ncbi:hypothetical protein R83H12_01208 [Fibrobacteria bacterium R8-3-H12]
MSLRNGKPWHVSGPSTDAKTLEMLSESAEPNPILGCIMSWRELQKLQGGYTEALSKKRHAFGCSDCCQCGGGEQLAGSGELI